METLNFLDCSASLWEGGWVCQSVSSGESRSWEYPEMRQQARAQSSMSRLSWTAMPGRARRQKKLGVRAHLRSRAKSSPSPLPNQRGACKHDLGCVRERACSIPLPTRRKCPSSTILDLAWWLVYGIVPMSKSQITSGCICNSKNTATSKTQSEANSLVDFGSLVTVRWCTRLGISQHMLRCEGCNSRGFSLAQCDCCEKDNAILLPSLLLYDLICVISNC